MGSFATVFLFIFTSALSSRGERGGGKTANRNPASAPPPGERSKNRTAAAAAGWKKQRERRHSGATATGVSTAYDKSPLSSSPFLSFWHARVSEREVKAFALSACRSTTCGAEQKGGAPQRMRLFRARPGQAGPGGAQSIERGRAGRQSGQRAWPFFSFSFFPCSLSLSLCARSLARSVGPCSLRLLFFLLLFGFRRLVTALLNFCCCLLVF